MAWIDGKLEWLEPYINGPKYKKELNEIYFSFKRTDEVMRQLNNENKRLKSYNDSAYKQISSLEIEAKKALPSIFDSEYWNTKYPQKRIIYPNVDVRTHLKFREIKGVADIAQDIMEHHHFETIDDVANAWNKWALTNIEHKHDELTLLKSLNTKLRLKKRGEHQKKL